MVVGSYTDWSSAGSSPARTRPIAVRGGRSVLCFQKRKGRCGGALFAVVERGLVGFFRRWTLFVRRKSCGELEEFRQGASWVLFVSEVEMGRRNPKVL